MIKERSQQLNQVSKVKKHPHERGALAIELLVGFPLVLLMLLSIIQFGHMMMVRNMSTSAAREGARLAILPSSTNVFVTQGETAFHTLIFNRVTDILDDAGITINSDDVAITLTDNADGTAVEVEVDVDYADEAIIPGLFSNITFTGNVVMRQESF